MIHPLCLNAKRKNTKKDHKLTLLCYNFALNVILRIFMFKNIPNSPRQEHYNRIMAEIKLLQASDNPTPEDYKKINDLTQIALKLVQRTSSSPDFFSSSRAPCSPTQTPMTKSSSSVDFVPVGSLPRDPSPIKIQYNEAEKQRSNSITESEEQEMSDDASQCSSSSDRDRTFSVFAGDFEEDMPELSESPYNR
jgi:hypothetical protein